MNPRLEETYTLIARYGRLLALSLSPSTRGSEANRLKRSFRHLLMAGKDYKSVTKDDIDLYLSLQGCKQDHNAQCVLGLRRFYTYLGDKHVVSHNPAEQINERFPPRKSLVAVAPKNTVRRVLRKLQKDTSPAGLVNRLLVELAYGSGMRRAELARLNVEDINMTEQTAHVLGKNRKERVVPLTKRCFNALRYYWSPPEIM